jgi:predicted DNA-binding transcriptional regulator AlpA
MARRTRTVVHATGMSPDEKLTLAELCAELKIQRSTFYDWRAKGRAPRCMKLPNGEIRVMRRDLEAWLESCLVQ